MNSGRSGRVQTCVLRRLTARLTGALRDVDVWQLPSPYQALSSRAKHGLHPRHVRMSRKS